MREYERESETSRLSSICTEVSSKAVVLDAFGEAQDG
jgi:hypothetical protein